MGEPPPSVSAKPPHEKPEPGEMALIRGRLVTVHGFKKTVIDTTITNGLRRDQIVARMVALCRTLPAAPG